ncbi:1,2-phenylacetyl-CoA epoxidase subunit PaaD [Prosthecomicrobium sp. N25]|uniref:1,2-phenylacetyl-CoA epoxidase subunit PaaD n=1 Tax=Prosthecomicrobium sp. N25 TaxID=3129254 RepID=UPI0030768D04
MQPSSAPLSVAPAPAGPPETEADRLARARAAAATVCDPEIPVLSIEDLGVLRDVRFDPAGRVEVTITPTYSGCPAMNMIAVDIAVALDRAGFPDARVVSVLTPAWSTDLMTERGRDELRRYGIAPPVGRARTGRRALFGETAVACPKCGSPDTERISEFGSTACKALYRCRACREPFDYFKCI